MKITFSNLGAIKKTTLDLRPLTVIIGPNNSNKTYIAYSIYGLLDLTLGSGIDISDFSFKNISDNTLSLAIDEDFFNTFKIKLKKAIKKFKEELETFFQDTTTKLFSETTFEIEFSMEDIQQALYRLVKRDFYPFHNVTELEFDGRDLIIKFINSKESDKSDESDEKSINLSRGTLNALLNLGSELIATNIIHTAFNYLTSNNLLLLPAERNAFIITYKILANKRLKNLREIHRVGISQRSKREIELLREQGDIRYPQPIEDFLDFLSDIEFENNIFEETKEKKIFYDLANKIEKSIQGKNKTNFIPTKFGGKELKINVKKGLDIDLYNASSSIKQLAPLLLYLRYRAQQGDLLIIDEPEMNLHPESQAKLLEVLGMLVNAGVNVLLTTHSPYFMSHLNNLIASDMTDESVREKQAKSLYLQDSRAFLKPEDVSAYEMRQNKKGEQTLHDLHDKDYGIRWDTLSDVSADIQKKFFEIYEKGEETFKGKKN